MIFREMLENNNQFLKILCKCFLKQGHPNIIQKQDGNFYLRSNQNSHIEKYAEYTCSDRINLEILLISFNFYYIEKEVNPIIQWMCLDRLFQQYSHDFIIKGYLFYTILKNQIESFWENMKSNNLNMMAFGLKFKKN